MRTLLALLFLTSLPACTADNPDADPLFMICFHAHEDTWERDCRVPADLAMAPGPDLASATCGRPGEPCCRDTNARLFCSGEAVCAGERCSMPDLAPTCDLASAGPDLVWRPDLLGGACVGRCGSCTSNRDCCLDPQWPAGCLRKDGTMVQAGEVGRCDVGFQCY